MINHGCDIDIEDSEGFTPLHYGNALLMMIVQFYYKFLSIIASGRGHLPVVQYLIKCGSNIEARDKIFGRTALHWGTKKYLFLT